MSLPEVDIERKRRKLTHGYRLIMGHALQTDELANRWKTLQASTDHSLELEIVQAIDETQFREERQKMDQEFSEFVMLLENWIEGQPAFGPLRNLRDQIHPQYRIGVLVIAAPIPPPSTALAPQSRVGYSATDVRFLRALKISPDDLP